MTEVEKSIENVNVIGIGHVDNGKTTLIAAITKIINEVFSEGKEAGWEGKGAFIGYEKIDKAPEERKRGITISTSHIGFRYGKTEKVRQYTWIDCPGHADYIKNMLTGAAQGDLAVLIVSATNVQGSSAMPQDREHILLAKQIGIKKLIVFINKMDAPGADPESTKLLLEDILTQQGYGNSPFILGSARCALEGKNPEIGEKSIISLLKEVYEAGVPERDLESPFLMPIEDVFSISGRGTVVTGKIERGIMEEGPAEIVGYDEFKPTRIVSIEMHHKKLEKGEAVAGANVGVLLGGKIAREGVRRGQVLVQPGSISSHDKFSATIHILKEEEGGRKTPFFKGYRPQFHFGTADVTGEVIELPKDKSGEEKASPGETTQNIKIKLYSSIPITTGREFIIREGSKTVGIGRVTEIDQTVKAK